MNKVSFSKDEIKSLIKGVGLKSSAKIVVVLQKSIAFFKFFPKSLKLKFTRIIAKNKLKKLNLHRIKDKLGVSFL